MFSRTLVIAFLCFGMHGPAAAQSAATDLEVLADYLSGVFDSEAQNTAQAAAGVPETDRHVRVTILQRPVDLEAFDGHVWYNQEYRDGDPAKLIRQRLVTLNPDSAAGTLRMKQYFFNDPSEFVDAHLELDKLDGLSMEDVWLLPGCDVFWRRSGDVFTGTMKDSACRFAIPEGAREKTVVYKIVLDADSFQRVDRSVFSDSGEVSGGRADDEPTVHTRITAPWD